MDLTKGPIGRQLVLFALPLFGSSLIQQLYHTVDLMFVGKLLGKEASAAVGASSMLVTCILCFFTGMGAGVGIAVSQAFGAAKEGELRRIIHNGAGLTLLGAVLFAAFGWGFAPVFLQWIHTPENIIPQAILYIRIYFLSLLSIISYNIASGILRALGNSRSPMLYQLWGGIANIIGDWFFMAVLQMGVSGAAIATLFSQSVAAVLTVRHLYDLPESYALRLHKIELNGVICKRIFSVGIPAAIQSLIISLSNVIIQARINTLGIDSMAAFVAYFKVENFIYLPIIPMRRALQLSIPLPGF